MKFKCEYIDEHDMVKIRFHCDKPLNIKVCDEVATGIYVYYDENKNIKMILIEDFSKSFYRENH